MLNAIIATNSSERYTSICEMLGNVPWLAVLYALLGALGTVLFFIALLRLLGVKSVHDLIGEAEEEDDYGEY